MPRRKRQPREAGEPREIVKPVRRVTRESSDTPPPANEWPEAPERKAPKRHVVPDEETVQCIGVESCCIGGTATVNPGQVAHVPKAQAAKLEAAGILRIVEPTE